MLSTPTYASKSDKEVVNYILLWMGPQAVEVFDNWSHLSDQQKVLVKCGMLLRTILNLNQILG